MAKKTNRRPVKASFDLIIPQSAKKRIVELLQNAKKEGEIIHITSLSWTYEHTESGQIFFHGRESRWKAPDPKTARK